MREANSEPGSTSKITGRTIFPTVPINTVPVAASPGDAGADHPVVLVVSKEPDIADAVSEILNRNGYAAIAAYDAEDALETALLIPPELVISEIGLPGMSGVEVAAALKKELPDCKILLLAGPAETAEVRGTAKAAGLKIAVVDKAVAPTELVAQVSAHLLPGQGST